MSKRSASSQQAKDAHSVPFSADFGDVTGFKYANVVGTTVTPFDIRVLFADVHPNEGKGIQTENVAALAIPPECAIALVTTLLAALNQFKAAYLPQRELIWHALSAELQSQQTNLRQTEE